MSDDLNCRRALEDVGARKRKQPRGGAEAAFRSVL